MKIACIGNMNNIMFQLIRYLTDDGYDITLFLLDEFEHFLPQADSFESVDKYKIIKLGWNSESFINVSIDEIKKAFKGFDFYIGTDIAPALMYKIGMRLDIFIPHGSDLYDFPFKKYRNFPAQKWEIPKYITGKYQYLGIHETSIVSADLGDEIIEKPIRDIQKNGGQRIISPPIMYLKQYINGYEKKSAHYTQFLDIRSKYKFIVFQHSSQDWSDRGGINLNKGNDILIKAFAKYLKNGKNADDSVLVLLEYGIDLNKSKELIKSLGIENNVIWLPKMFRKDLMAAIAMSDICVGELGKRGWYCYSCIFEFMVMKKPLLHHRNDEHYRNLNMELYPMVDADNVEIVKNTFLDFRVNPTKYIKMGEDVFQWLAIRTGKCLEAFKNEIENKKNNAKAESNIITNPFRKLFLYLNPSLVYSYILLKLYSLKENE